MICRTNYDNYWCVCVCSVSQDGFPLAALYWVNSECVYVWTHIRIRLLSVVCVCVNTPSCDLVASHASGFSPVCVCAPFLLLPRWFMSVDLLPSVPAWWARCRSLWRFPSGRPARRCNPSPGNTAASPWWPSLCFSEVCLVHGYPANMDKTN